MVEGSEQASPGSLLPVLEDVLDLPDGEHQPLLVTELVEPNVLKILNTDAEHLLDCRVALKQ